MEVFNPYAKTRKSTGHQGSTRYGGLGEKGRTTSTSSGYGKANHRGNGISIVHQNGPQYTTTKDTGNSEAVSDSITTSVIGSTSWHHSNSFDPPPRKNPAVKSACLWNTYNDHETQISNDRQHIKGQAQQNDNPENDQSRKLPSTDYFGDDDGIDWASIPLPSDDGITKKRRLSQHSNNDNNMAASSGQNRSRFSHETNSHAPQTNFRNNTSSPERKSMYAGLGPTNMAVFPSSPKDLTNPYLKQHTGDATATSQPSKRITTSTSYSETSSYVSSKRNKVNMSNRHEPSPRKSLYDSPGKKSSPVAMVFPSSPGGARNPYLRGNKTTESLTNSHQHQPHTNMLGAAHNQPSPRKPLYENQGQKLSTEIFQSTTSNDPASLRLKANVQASTNSVLATGVKRSLNFGLSSSLNQKVCESHGSPDRYISPHVDFPYQVKCLAVAHRQCSSHVNSTTTAPKSLQSIKRAPPAPSQSDNLAKKGVPGSSPSRVFNPYRSANSTASLLSNNNYLKSSRITIKTAGASESLTYSSQQQGDTIYAPRLQEPPRRTSPVSKDTFSKSNPTAETASIFALEGIQNYMPAPTPSRQEDYVGSTCKHAHISVAPTQKVLVPSESSSRENMGQPSGANDSCRGGDVPHQSMSSLRDDSSISHRSNLVLDRPPEWSKRPVIDVTGSNSAERETLDHATAAFSSKPDDTVCSIYDNYGKQLPVLPRELHYDSSRIRPVDDDYRHTLVKNANVNAKLKNGWTLLQHQKKAVLRGLQTRRLILAYDMGLGKTLISCVWANAFLKTFEGLKVFVIAPVSLQQDWMKTARNCTDILAERTDRGSSENEDESESESESISSEEDDTSDSDDSTDNGRRRRLRRSKSALAKKKKKKKKQPKRKITKKEILAAQVKKRKDIKERDIELDKADNKRFEVFSWGKLPEIPDKGHEVKQYVVICDEAHSIQSMTSGRTKETLKLLKYKACVGCLLLSGTPMKNGKPANLIPLLRGVRHPLADRQRAFEVCFCNGHDKNYGRRSVWDANGSSNLELLNAHIASHMLYMSKEEALKQLPGKRRDYRRIPCSSTFETRHRKALSDLGKTMEYSDNNSEKLLAAFQRVRLVAALAKIAGTVSLAKEILESEPAIVIFTSFVEVAKTVHKQLEECGWSGALLTGEVPGKKRQQLVDDFQSGITSVFVSTFGAGGVGLTLTAARTIILLDRPWTPGEAAQAEDRVRRIGQTKDVISIWVRCFEVDTQIDDLIEKKQHTSNTVVDTRRVKACPSTSPVTSSPAKQAPKISIFQLVRSIIPSGTK
jgi:hypothetical protein